jgi:hypothetical protein
MQEAFYAVVKARNPGEIENLRAYFCRVLVREAHRLRSQQGASPDDDVADAIDVRPDTLVSQSPAPPVDETVIDRLRKRTLHERFTARRAYLVRNVPGRSPDPAGYRNLIVSVAERLLRSSLSGDACDADGNLALSAAYPEWFVEKECGRECASAFQSGARRCARRAATRRQPCRPDVLRRHQPARRYRPTWPGWLGSSECEASLRLTKRPPPDTSFMSQAGVP